MTLEVKQEIPWTKVRSYTDGNPWCIAFVYPRKSKAFVVKGGINQVKEWVKGQHLKRALIHYTMFGKEVLTHKSAHRSSVEILTGSPTVKAFISRIRTDRVTGKKAPKDRRWQLLVFTTDGKPHSPFSGEGSRVVLDKRLRRPPRCWPKELDEFVMPAVDFPCASCEHSIKGPGGKYGVTGCKLTKFFKSGKNCPLGKAVKAKPVIVAVSCQPDFLPHAIASEPVKVAETPEEN